MANKKMHDIFITHAWRYHDDWTKLCDLLDKSSGFAWRNFSLPWHDPAMNPNSEVGGAFIRSSLETQIIPAQAVILLAGVYSIKSAQRWLNLEVEFARKHKKPIIAIPALGETGVPDNIISLCDRSVGWDPEAIIAALSDAIDQPQ